LAAANTCGRILHRQVRRTVFRTSDKTCEGQWGPVHDRETRLNYFQLGTYDKLAAFGKALRVKPHCMEKMPERKA
jgi:hypothetical protein